MLLSQVKTSQGQDAVIAERRASYTQKAIAFLNKTFHDDMALCPPDQQLRLVKLAYSAASKRGLMRERDHLQYLSICVYWGVAFDTDPQHRPAMIRAGWLKADGALRASTDFDALLAAVNHWLCLTQCDCDDGPDVVARLRHAMIAGDAFRTTSQAQQILQDVWPDRFGVLSPQIRDAATHAGLEQASVLGLRGGDAILYAALAIHFGYWFHSDPHYSDLGAALRSEGSDADRRLALAHAIKTRWAATTGEPS